MHKIKEFIIVLIVSGIIGSVVGFPSAYLRGERIVYFVCMSGVVGMIIGFCATLSFVFFYININKHPMVGFLSIAVIIGVGTFLGPVVLGVDNIFYIFMMIIAAEITGMAASFIIYRKTKVLNQSLRKTQEKFRP